MKMYRENGFPVTIIRPSHTYDERSVPLGVHGDKGSWQVVKRMMEGKPVIIHGDGTNRSLLLEEGLKEADAFCCLTGIDEENIVLSLFAKNAAPNIKTITKVNHTLFREVIETLDIDSVVYPKFTTASIILKHVRAQTAGNGRNEVHKLTRIINNKVEAIEFQVSHDSSLANCAIQNLTLRPNILLGTITRGDTVIIPSGADVLMPGDSVVVVTSTERLSSLDDILE